MSTTRKPGASHRTRRPINKAARHEAIERQRRRTTALGVGILAALALLIGAIVWSQEPRDAGAQATPTGNSSLVPGADFAGGQDWTLTLATNLGTIVATLDGVHAPQATSVLLDLQQQGYFDGTDCHRLTTTEPYLLTCGDPTGTGTGGPPYRFGPIENAPADNVYPAGSIIMWRAPGDGRSMGSQFAIVYQDSTIPADKAGGYTVVGTVTQGLDIVRSVAEGGTITGASDGHPAQSVILTKVTAS